MLDIRLKSLNSNKLQPSSNLRNFLFLFPINQYLTKNINEVLKNARANNSTAERDA